MTMESQERYCWPYFDPEYENFSFRVNPPRIVIDNETDNGFSLVKIASTNRPGTLLEVVQVLADLDLNISKAYISSDGGYLMDVFHVTDQLGNKIMDEKLIEFLQQSLVGKRENAASSSEVRTCLGRVVGGANNALSDYTVLELVGKDRRGILSEISAVLTSLECNVVAAESWTHNERLACVVYMTDQETNGRIEDTKRLSLIKDQVRNVLRAANADIGDVQLLMEFSSSSKSLVHKERRLHQIMLADRDHRPTVEEDKENIERHKNVAAAVDDHNHKPSITVENCNEKGYSVVNIACKDRPKLLFDIVCTLTDMQYAVFHACICSDGHQASQEYYIRHVDGYALDTQYESQCVIKCLEAAIERRVSEGLKVEVYSVDRVGLLSEVTRLLRENGLTVTRADVTTQGNTAFNTFYVTDACGGPVDMKVVDAMTERFQDVGPIKLHIEEYGKADCRPQSQSIFTMIKSQWEKVLTGWGH